MCFYSDAHSDVQMYHTLSCPHAGSLLPVTVFDGHSLRVLFHFARDSPPSRPDVLVVIISMLSSAPIPVTSINFCVTAPKVSSHNVEDKTSLSKPAALLLSELRKNVVCF